MEYSHYTKPARDGDSSFHDLVTPDITPNIASLGERVMYDEPASCASRTAFFYVVVFLL